ncbi:MAG: FAD-dependent oxidoreductase [Sandaracinaceae bacterium]
MDALIIGGGIAGCLTAVGLAKVGIRSTVYERRAPDEPLAIGAWLSVACNGLAAMRTLGVADDVMRRGFPSQRIEICGDGGALLGAVPLGGTLSDGTTTHTLKRTDLYRAVLRAAEAAGATFVHGRSLETVEQRDDGVIARFDDGSSARGAFLVGADGVGSRVRRALDPQAPEMRFGGLGNLGGFTPAAGLAVEPDTYRMTFGRRCFFGYVVSPSGEVWWFANPPRKEPYSRERLERATDADWKREIGELLEGEPPRLAEIVAGSGPIIATNQYDLPRVRTWRSGRAVLVGDAAHAANPASGQGVSLAAEDAVALAMCLRDVRDPARAFAAFEAVRRPRAERVVAHGARMSSAKAAGPIGRAIRDLMMPMFLRRQAKTAASSLAWLFDHRLDWNETIGAAA